ncbi:unnamed protein product [Penicillium salamii]|nr:unnamed protein product [Penicillium salamii]CAG8375243.1 unnamed protein product [Penicillium salamii]
MPKVRTGCSTCKIRRVKCDEQQPKCRRCVSTGRTCPGYPGKPSATTIEIYNLPFKVPGSRTDREMLHFYHSHVAESISKLSDSSIWLQLIMQQSQYHSVVRNALVSLSSVYKDYSQLGPSTKGTSTCHLEIINKAHRQLRLHLSSRGASVMAALICSLIFYILECLVGNTEHAILHLDQGLILLQRYRDESLSLDFVPGFDQLLAVLSRLDIHASVFDDERRPILRLSPANHTSLPTLSQIAPNSLRDLSSAERELTMLQNSVMHHLISHAEHKHKPRDDIPSWMIDESHYLEQEMQRLEMDLENLVLSPWGGSHNQLHQRKILIQVEASVFHGALLEAIDSSSGKPASSTAADRRFDLALSRIRALLPLSPKSTSDYPTREFTLSTNLIAILYYICMKSASREIVESALSIMQDSLSSTRDGLWDASMAVGVVQSLLLQKEYPKYDPKEARLEDLGSGIVDTSGGLEEAFRKLSLKSPETKSADAVGF